MLDRGVLLILFLFVRTVSVLAAPVVPPDEGPVERGSSGNFFRKIPILNIFFKGAISVVDTSQGGGSHGSQWFMSSDSSLSSSEGLLSSSEGLLSSSEGSSWFSESSSSNSDLNSMSGDLFSWLTSTSDENGGLLSDIWYSSEPDVSHGPISIFDLFPSPSADEDWPEEVTVNPGEVTAEPEEVTAEQGEVTAESPWVELGLN